MGKIIASVGELAQIVAQLKSQNKIVVAINGCFDAFHTGHEYFINQAKQHGDVLIVLMNTDDYITKTKGQNRPLDNQQKRLENVAAHKQVDFVCIFNQDTPIQAFDKIKPDIYCSSIEYAPNPIEKPTIEKNNGKVVFIEKIKDHSTSKILIEKGIIKQALHGPGTKSCPKYNEKNH